MRFLYCHMQGMQKGLEMPWCRPGFRDGVCRIDDQSTDDRCPIVQRDPDQDRVHVRGRGDAQGIIEKGSERD